MTDQLQIHQDADGGYQVLHLEGRLDASSSPLLEEKFNELIQGKAAKFVINLSKLEYLSSSGMRLFLSKTKQLKSMDGQLRFCEIHDEVMEIIKMAGFERILDIYRTQQEATS